MAISQVYVYTNFLINHNFALYVIFQLKLFHENFMLSTDLVLHGFEKFVKSKVSFYVFVLTYM